MRESFNHRKLVELELLCKPSTMKVLIDNFEIDVDTEPVEGEHFKAKVMVCTSPTFYRWVFEFNGSIKIVGPQNVVAEYQKLLHKALEDYTVDNN